MKIDPRQLEILAAIIQAAGLTGGLQLQANLSPYSYGQSRHWKSVVRTRTQAADANQAWRATGRGGRKVLQADEAAPQFVQSLRAGKAEAVRMADAPIYMDGVIVAMIAVFQAQNPQRRN